jgi:hypothetical protein
MGFGGGRCDENVLRSGLMESVSVAIVCSLSRTYLIVEAPAHPLHA